MHPYKKIKSAILKANHIVILTHWTPDGDAMGSSLGLMHYIKQLGKKATVIIPNDFPDFLAWMPGAKSCIDFLKEEKKATSTLLKSDLIFTLDFNNFSRLEKLGDVVKNSNATKILIDHHQQPDNYATYSIHDTQVSSTCELVYSLIAGAGDKKLINKNIASCLYTGIMTDTGGFRFPSVKPLTHIIAAHLIEVGAKHNEIYNLVNDTFSFDRLKLIGFGLGEKLKLMDGFAAAYMSFTAEELARHNYKKGDTEGLVNYALSIEGVVFSTFFSESEGATKCSFRSKGTFDVNTFARNHFNGGGHKNAAGGKYMGTAKQAITHLEECVLLYKSELKK